MPHKQKYLEVRYVTTPSFPVYKAYLNFFIFANLKGSSPSPFEIPGRIKSLHARIKKKLNNACNVPTHLVVKHACTVINPN